MDIIRQLRSAMNGGNLLFGQKQANDACSRGDAKLILLAANCPQDYIDELHAKYPDVTMHRVTMVNRELGSACAKPFAISTICVIDAGNSELLTLRTNLD